jgi:hypothetical protein
MNTIEDVETKSWKQHVAGGGLYNLQYFNYFGKPYSK